jgi:divalent metal cation (Fe/Co/Zn/Cd) transporter
MVTKTITTVLVLLGVIFLSALTFNHISPWLGVGIAILAIYLAGKRIDNEIKNK